MAPLFSNSNKITLHNLQRMQNKAIKLIIDNFETKTPTVTEVFPATQLLTIYRRNSVDRIHKIHTQN